MKIFFKLFIIMLIATSCNSTQSVAGINDEAEIPEEDIVRFSSNALEYEIIIIEPGFNSWLSTMAQPEGYYSQSYMESRNNVMVQEWNTRVLQPLRYSSELYQLQIDYRPGINYGYELNYKLYNYFIYFQLTYKQKLSAKIPRI
ncbi:DUF6146 family protein [Psychroserpens ponticola]|uniref:DUF6146 family protein n=1 Tax=Psychroserpens ponticola TaxID=2932268 RepID=A0ABY7S278_9FLAO|nr:DUF6146 family protein [Psychroserpens ponticola]WCO03289.1 DUF6146 family protein [Psychroserpens ponticola]